MQIFPLPCNRANTYFDVFYIQSICVNAPAAKDELMRGHRA
jgi:hypothetical protein